MRVRPIARWLPTMITWCPAALCILCAWPASALAQRRAPSQSIEQARNRMVDEELVGAGIKDARVIGSMRSTPRHEFVARKYFDKAYLDMSLPIGEGQTISPPMFVAYMTEQLEPQPSDRVLEIGTGSGYQAAVLSPLVKEVYTIEIVESLGKHAQQTLKRLKYANVFVKIGDGYLGWEEHAPFDKIIVTCSPEKVPQPLIDQLKEGGRMIIPVGERYQQVFHLLKKQDGKLLNEALRPTLFVPMTGKAEEKREVQPDPLHPKLVNGGFEEVIGDSGEPAGWYYVRQMKVVRGAGAPEGRNYVTFSNSDPGRACRAIQGFPIDGSKVHEFEVSCMVRAPGVARNQAAQLVVLFMDENLATVGQVALGPWRGITDWKRVSGVVKVPAHARSGSVQIGLLGGIGEASYDDVQIRPKGQLGVR